MSHTTNSRPSQGLICRGVMAADEREKLVLQYRTLKGVVEKPSKTYDGAARVLEDQAESVQDIVR